MTAAPVLAHAGPGSTWQAMVVVAGVVLAGVVVLAALGRVRVEQPDDLVVPLAGTAIVSGLGVLGHLVISDLVGWGLPLAVVSLLTLLLAAFTPLDIRIPAPLPMGAVPLAVIAMVLLHGPLTITLHPPVELLPLAADAQVRIVAPDDGATVEAPVEVTVAVEGGSIGPGDLPLERLPDDPQEAGQLLVLVGEVGAEGGTGPRSRVEPTYEQHCSLEAPCDDVGFEVPLEPGTWQLSVEFARGDGTPLAPSVRDRVTVEVG